MWLSPGACVDSISFLVSNDFHAQTIPRHLPQVLHEAPQQQCLKSQSSKSQKKNTTTTNSFWLFKKNRQISNVCHFNRLHCNFSCFGVLLAHWRKSGRRWSQVSCLWTLFPFSPYQKKKPFVIYLQLLCCWFWKHFHSSVFCFCSSPRSNFDNCLVHRIRYFK